MGGRPPTIGEDTRWPPLPLVLQRDVLPPRTRKFGGGTASETPEQTPGFVRASKDRDATLLGRYVLPNTGVSGCAKRPIKEGDGTVRPIEVRCDERSRRLPGWRVVLQLAVVLPSLLAEGPLPEGSGDRPDLSGGVRQRRLDLPPHPHGPALEHVTAAQRLVDFVMPALSKLSEGRAVDPPGQAARLHRPDPGG